VDEGLADLEKQREHLEQQQKLLVDWIEIELNARIDKEKRQAIAILEHKPFWLPLTASERQELSALKDDIEKAAQERKNRK
jgi:hypothetical protein